MKKEYGRSMIEMLGVLAIIGVLSIGGLAGYTMAMNRHRANVALDYAQRAFVVAQTFGDGSQEIASTTECASTSILNETLPSASLSTCTVGRTANGATTITITPANDSVSEAIANRLGLTSKAAKYTMTDTGTDANVWKAGS